MGTEGFEPPLIGFFIAKAQRSITGADRTARLCYAPGEQYAVGRGLFKKISKRAAISLKHHPVPGLYPVALHKPGFCLNNIHRHILWLII